MKKKTYAVPTHTCKLTQSRVRYGSNVQQQCAAMEEGNQQKKEREANQIKNYEELIQN